MHIDADELAREVVEPGQPALAEIAREFGAAVLTAEGRLDRAAMASIIFVDPERRAALNAITHPAVKQRAGEIIASASVDPAAVVVYDVPLLVEAGVDSDHPFDLVVVVHASTETRIQRLVQLRGLPRDEAVHRLNSQVTDTERLAIADVVIDSNGTLEETMRQADALWERVSRSATSKLHD